MLHAQTKTLDTPYEKGTFENGYPVGVWKFFDKPEKEAALVVDYSKNQVLFLQADTSRYALKINNNWEYRVPSQQARFLGSMYTFYEFFYKNIQFPKEVEDKKEMGKVYLYFEVDTLGKAGNMQVYGNECHSCKEAVQKAFSHTPNFWLPAKINGKNVAASFILPVVFSVTGPGNSAYSETKAIKLPKAKMLEETGITIREVISFSPPNHAQTRFVDTPYEKGKDEKGFPVGVWKYYDRPGEEAALIIDYTKGKLIYLEPDTAAYALKINDEWEYSVPQQQARFIGSMFTFYDTFSRTVEYPRASINNNETGLVYLYFEVDTLGKAGNLQTFSTTCESCGDAAKLAFNHIPNFWLPAKVNDTYVPASFILPIVFKIHGKRRPTSDYPIPNDLPKAKMLAQTVVEVASVIRVVKVGSPAITVHREKKKKSKKAAE